MNTQIRIHTFVDGFFELSAFVNGKRIAVLYSDRTTGNDALADFAKIIQAAEQNTDGSCRN